MKATRNSTNQVMAGWWAPEKNSWEAHGWYLELTGRCNISKCQKRKWKQETPPKDGFLSTYSTNHKYCEAVSRYATQIVPAGEFHSGWGHWRSGAALGLEARSYIEISKVPLLLNLFERVWRWKGLKRIFLRCCWGLFIFQVWQVRSHVSKASYFNYQGRERPTKVGLRLNSSFSGWREGKAGGCG